MSNGTTFGTLRAEQFSGHRYVKLSQFVKSFVENKMPTTVWMRNGPTVSGFLRRRLKG
jgi:hypothetical protein